ncbi:TM2 domain-containing protein [Candidatus Uabimicrobium sp. HlEnr_7]|uniref:TM2 domain-containing protein n=1 Tax=Candidatus Uabimicrobium helgolandensis TaxID=3095367 RepID=UPI0035579533
MDSNVDFEEKAHQKITYVKAYLAWLFGGWMGMHRFYLGKWFSGGVYMVSFGFFFMGWGIDFFLIPFMVKKQREKLAEKLRVQAEWAKKIAEASGDEAIVFEEKLAPWAGKSDWKSYLEFPFRLMFFFFAPMLFTYIALAQGNWELILVMAVILIATSFIYSVQRIIHFHPEIEKIPLLSDALSTFKKLHAYYMENKPRNFLFYVGYFVFGFLSMPFSKKTREEFSLYKSIIFGIFALLILETVLSYNSVYPPYLNVQEALGVLLAEFFLLFFMIISFMMPMVTTSFSLSLSGKHNMLRFLTFIGIGFSILLAVFAYTKGDLSESASMADTMNFEARMKNKDFRTDITTSSEMFLSYYGQKSKIKQVASVNIHVDESMTELYRRNLEGFVAGNETALVHVFVIEQPGEHLVFGIRYNNRILFLVDHSGEVYKNWRRVPQVIQDMFEEKILMPLGDEKYRCVVKKGLITDLY